MIEAALRPDKLGRAADKKSPGAVPSVNGITPAAPTPVRISAGSNNAEVARSTVQTGRAYSDFTEVDCSFILADRAFIKIDNTN
jgi:hypothetical protein